MKHRFTVTEKDSEVQFRHVSQDLLTHNPRQGVNYWGGAEYPTMLIWAGRIYDFLRVLEGIVGYYPARMQSYQVGYTSGWNGAEVSAGFPNDAPVNDGKVRLLSLGNSILSGAGWGRCEIEYDDATGSVRWEFSEGTAIGLAARQEGRRDKPACPFVAGFVAGWTNRSLGTKSEFQETECVSKGDARCVFESADYLRPRAE
ncbi:MAG: hypothetical protein E6K05_02435 [Methanobacteriota archaeon]|nr:MAG: hypothetical protein E6K05_02435 [Euryarchaeota archaeon]